jgi:glutamyl-tRNA synthetase
MHLGNARTALLAWLDARARGGRVLLRIEDLDRERCRPEFAGGIRDDLRWLGFDWDGETAPQSSREDAYREAVARLERDGLAYECFCTRREVAVASAPHGHAGLAPCPRRCRDLPEAERVALRREGRRAAVRVRMPAGSVTIGDRVHGPVPVAIGADPVIRRSDGLHAYQLAVVVDDAADGVTDVVRGDDLLPSSGIQVTLAGMLGLQPVRYAHVPLVLGPDGARLAKRHGAVTVAELRDAGTTAHAMVGRLAASCGLGAGSPISPGDLVAGFDIAAIRRDPWRLSAPVSVDSSAGQ